MEWFTNNDIVFSFSEYNNIKQIRIVSFEKLEPNIPPRKTRSTYRSLLIVSCRGYWVYGDEKKEENLLNIIKFNLQASTNVRIVTAEQYPYHRPLNRDLNEPRSYYYYHNLSSTLNIL
jgi:hypothetical protein